MLALFLPYSSIFVEYCPEWCSDFLISRLTKTTKAETEECKQPSFLSFVLIFSSSKRGVVFLKGALPNVVQHSIVLQLVTDVLGFQDVVGRIEVEQLAWQREDRDKPQLEDQRKAGERRTG